jgi:hypothetical protein
MNDQPVEDSLQNVQESLQKIEKHFFQTPTFQALTIGVPFSIFKILFGILSIRTGTDQQYHLVIFGWLVILWGLADLVMNLIVVAFNIAGRESPIEFCTMPSSRLLGNQSVLADTLIAFSIVCFVLWSGWIRLLNNESISDCGHHAQPQASPL